MLLGSLLTACTPHAHTHAHCCFPLLRGIGLSHADAMLDVGSLCWRGAALWGCHLEVWEDMLRRLRRRCWGVCQRVRRLEVPVPPSSLEEPCLPPSSCNQKPVTMPQRGGQTGNSDRNQASRPASSVRLPAGLVTSRAVLTK